VPRFQADPVERFWGHVIAGPVPDWRPELGPCRIWTGPKGGAGKRYGRIRWNGRDEYVHRIAFVLLHGPIPAGLKIEHQCRVALCVQHLEAVTQREYVLRGRGPTAINVLKTHCKRGHAFTLENTLPNRSTDARRCRTCHNDGARRRRAAHGTERIAPGDCPDGDPWCPCQRHIPYHDEGVEPMHANGVAKAEITRSRRFRRPGPADALPD
jgi:HNH endonuclease